MSTNSCTRPMQRIASKVVHGMHRGLRMWLDSPLLVNTTYLYVSTNNSGIRGGVYGSDAFALGQNTKNRTHDIHSSPSYHPYHPYHLYATHVAGSCSALRSASCLIRIGARVMRGRKIAQRPTEKRSAPRSLTKERYSRAMDEFAWTAGYKDLSIINLDLALATLDNARSPGLRGRSKVSAKWNQNPHLTTMKWL